MFLYEMHSTPNLGALAINPHNATPTRPEYYELFTGYSTIEFCKEFCEFYPQNILKRAVLSEGNEIDDIEQYGPGEYWCVTANCLEHYCENSYFLRVEETQMPPKLTIAVGEEYYFDEYAVELVHSYDGFYDPEYDTYGLVLFDKRVDGESEVGEEG